MKLTQIIKVTLDILMLILFILLICVSLTGIAFHEIAGFILLGIIAVHLMLNRRWISGVSRQIFNGKANNKAKVSYTVNFLLFLSSAITFLTGFCISQVIFPVNIGTPPLAAAHKWASYACLGLCAVHAVLHLQYIKNFVKKIRSDRLINRVWMAASSFGAAVVVSGIIYSQCMLTFKNSYNSGSDGNDSSEVLYVQPNGGQSIIYAEDNGDDTGTDEEETAVISEDNTQESVQTVTLQEFLEKMYCTACPKHCSLLSPRYGRGQAQVQQAKVEYEKIYETYEIN